MVKLNMSEKIPDQFEQTEKIPSPEEVIEILKQMTGGKDFKEVRRLLDEEDNLYRLDVVTEGTEEGETLELFYHRKVYPDGDKPAEINIHSTYVKGDSFGPAGPQADLIDGKWVFQD